MLEPDLVIPSLYEIILNIMAQAPLSEPSYPDANNVASRISTVFDRLKAIKKEELELKRELKKLFAKQENEALEELSAAQHKCSLISEQHSLMKTELENWNSGDNASGISKHVASSLMDFILPQVPMDEASNYRSSSTEDTGLDSELKVDYGAMIAAIMQQRQQEESRERSYIGGAEQSEKNAYQWTKMAALWEERNNEKAKKGAREEESRALQSLQTYRDLAKACRQKVEQMTQYIQVLISERDRDRKGDNETGELVLHK